MFSIISEEFSNGASRIRSQELQRSSFRSSSSHNNWVSQCIMIFQCLHDVSNSGSLLSNSHIDAVKSLCVVCVGVIKCCFLVNDGVNCNCSLACLSISNDEFSLTSANGHKGVYGLQTGLHGLMNGLSRDDTWGFELNSLSLVWLNGTVAIYGVSKRV
jgi:hypothetical protein